MEEIRVDMREMNEKDMALYAKHEELLFKLNQTMPRTAEYMDILRELFDGRIGEDSFVRAPLAGAALDKVTIGNRVFINNNLLAMARGGITIEDDVQIEANVQLLTNNHDPYERQILICKPILIKKGAWIGAGATITPGVTIGKYAIVGASAVVTHDVGDYEVVVGNPARVIKTLDAEKFDEINPR